MENYPEIEKLYKDIVDLTVQGATNVCIATFEGMKRYLDITRETDKEKLHSEFLEVGNRLAHARSNEPLARNGVMYVSYFFNKEFGSVVPEVSTLKKSLDDLCNFYLDLVSDSKRELLSNASRSLYQYDKVLTHCHSSTAVSLIKVIAKGDNDFEAVCTETRPRFQGRITAKSLLEAGIKTTLIADSAAESFVIGRGCVPIDVVFIGCDQITPNGHAINKIGSWGIAVAGSCAGKPVYIVSPLLKLDVETSVEDVNIEVREDRELWADAPDGLDMYNPAFEVVDNTLIAGYITEVGCVKPGDILSATKEKYPWVSDTK